MPSYLLIASYYCSAVAIFELLPPTSEVDEDVSGGQAQVFVRLAATSGELTFDIDVTIETTIGGTATGEFISNICNYGLTIFHFFL